MPPGYQKNSGLVSEGVMQLPVLRFPDFGILPEKLHSEFRALRCNFQITPQPQHT